jgi:hypothetical protein
MVTFIKVLIHCFILLFLLPSASGIPLAWQSLVMHDCQGYGLLAS